MQLSIRITPSLQGLVSQLGKDLEAGLDSGMETLLATIEAGAVRRAPVRTSNLVNSITHYIVKGKRQGVVKATAPYAAFVHFGTGIYGPRKKPITPTDKKALFWIGAAHPVRSVKGMKPRPFLYDAAEATDIQATFEKGIANFLRSRGW